MDNEAIVLRKQMDETLAGLTEKLGELEQQVAGTVRTVSDSVNTVRDTFDIKRHVRRRPWTLLAGATALGLLGGLRAGGRKTASQPRDCVSPDPNNLRPTRIRTAAGPSWLAHLGDALQPEIAELKGIVIGAALGLARDLIVKQASKSRDRSNGDPNNGHSGKVVEDLLATRRTLEL